MAYHYERCCKTSLFFFFFLKGVDKAFYLGLQYTYVQKNFKNKTNLILRNTEMTYVQQQQQRFTFGQQTRYACFCLSVGV